MDDLGEHHHPVSKWGMTRVQL